MTYNSSYSNCERECLIHMSRNGIIFAGPLIADGVLHRFSMDQKQNEADEWYIAWQFNSTKGVNGISCVYGTWSGGPKKFNYCSWDDDKRIDEHERKQLHEAMQVKRREHVAMLEKERLTRLKNAKDKWDKAQAQPTNPGHTSYLKSKMINAYGVKYGQDSVNNDVLIVPLINEKNEIQAIQCINGNGEKCIHGLKKGNFHIIGNIEIGSKIFVAEGYATGASIHEATGSPVFVAFDCGNLETVVATIRHMHPKNPIIICGDDDIDSPHNPGRAKAEETAKKHQCEVFFPTFVSDLRLSNGKRPSDFNDLHCHSGIEEVINQFKKAEQSHQQKKQVSGLQFCSAYSLTQEPPKANWLIQSYLDKGSLSMLFGEPGSMKSFLALDMGLCIATGRDWHGFPVRISGPVFYLAGEGFAGLRKRLRALAIDNNVNLKDVPFFVSDRPAQLLNQDSVLEIILAINELKDQYGEPALVIIDTLNRNFGPGDENSTLDMTTFVNNIDTGIRQRYDCAVMIVHHSPLNTTKRARGASSLHGALDWEYCLRKIGGDLRKLSVTKVKDYETPEELSFKPRSIYLDDWVDEDSGEVLTSCVLDRVGNIDKGSGDVGLKGPQKIAYDCLLELFELDTCNQSEGININDWRDATYKAKISSVDNAEAKKKAFQRAVRELREKGYVKANNYNWKPCGTRDIDGTFKGHVPDIDEGQTGHVF